MFKRLNLTFSDVNPATSDYLDSLLSVDCGSHHKSDALEVTSYDFEIQFIPSQNGIAWPLRSNIPMPIPVLYKNLQARLSKFDHSNQQRQALAVVAIPHTTPRDSHSPSKTTNRKSRFRNNHTNQQSDQARSTNHSVQATIQAARSKPLTFWIASSEHDPRSIRSHSQPYPNHRTPHRIQHQSSTRTI